MQRLFTAANLQEAYLLLHELAQAGISARVLNEHAYGALGELPFTHVYPEIWIDDDAALARGREILDQFRSRPVVDGTRNCRTCGESNPASFETCWHCGHELDATR